MTASTSHLHRAQVRAGMPLRLLDFVLATFPGAKRIDAKRWLKYRATTINDAPTGQFDAPLKPGDWVAVRAGKFAGPDTKLSANLKIVHEDADLVVIEKPPGLLTIATDRGEKQTAYAKLNAYLKGRGQNERIFVVHRLDRDTSGLLVFAKTPGAKRFLQENWDRAEKKYLAVVEGLPQPPQGTFRSHFDESEGEDPTRPDRFKVRSVKKATEATREAVTHYKTLRGSALYSLMEVALETGRRNQIRVHFSEAGWPVTGDPKYHAKRDPLRRLALHATLLRFAHPTGGKPMEFKCLAPSSFVALATGKGDAHAPKAKVPDAQAPSVRKSPSVNRTSPPPSARSGRREESGAEARPGRDRKPEFRPGGGRKR